MVKFHHNSNSNSNSQGVKSRAYNMQTCNTHLTAEVLANRQWLIFPVAHPFLDILFTTTSPSTVIHCMYPP